MPRFTDEQVEAARNASFDYLESRGCFSVLFPGDAEIEVDAKNDDEVNQVLHDAMRAALTAAADAAPAVDTTEFESLLARYDDWNYPTRRRHEFRHGLIRMFKGAAR